MPDVIFDNKYSRQHTSVLMIALKVASAEIEEFKKNLR